MPPQMGKIPPANMVPPGLVAAYNQLMVEYTTALRQGNMQAAQQVIVRMWNLVNPQPTMMQQLMQGAASLYRSGVNMAIAQFQAVMRMLQPYVAQALATAGAAGAWAAALGADFAAACWGGAVWLFTTPQGWIVLIAIVLLVLFFLWWKSEQQRLEELGRQQRAFVGPMQPGRGAVAASRGQPQFAAMMNVAGFGPLFCARSRRAPIGVG